MNTPRYRRWWPALLLLLLLLLGSGIVGYAWPDRKLAAAMAMRRELSSPAARSMSNEERQQKWRALRDLEKGFSPAQRRESSEEMRKRGQAKMASYFRMSKAEKNRFLDDQIRRSREAELRGAGASGGRGGTNPAQKTGGTGGKAGEGARGGSTTAERDARRRERLDSTTPAERAQMTQFFRDLSARRAQLGLPPGGDRGPRR